MALPLYRGAQLPPHRVNKGLLFDKFYLWDNLGGQLKDQKKLDNLSNFSGKCGDEKALEAASVAQCELVEALKGKFKVFRNEWHVIFGMGIDHPLENGMAWHPTLGVPYLAGSGVKGMVRAYCEAWKEWDSEKIVRCFGAESGSEVVEKAGDYIFFDAIPVKPADLTTDVMTPHMGKWYEKGGEEEHDYENIPGDWHAPVPVDFLAIKQISLVFGIASRPGCGSEEELGELMIALEEALQWIGAGAKTAVGYGHFVIDEIENKKKQRLFEDERNFEVSYKAILKSDDVTAIENFIEKHRGNHDMSEVISHLEHILANREAEKENRLHELEKKAKQAFDEMLKKRGTKGFARAKEKFVKKWSKPRENKGSKVILDFVEKTEHMKG